MVNLKTLINDAGKSFINLNIPIVAQEMLKDLIKLQDSNSTSLLHRGNFLNSFGKSVNRDILKFLAEVWHWLEINGFICPRPGGTNGPDWIMVTRFGYEFSSNNKEFVTFRFKNFLPNELLFPDLFNKIFPSFVVGDYDTAVFNAFKMVEIEVRKKGGYSDNVLGVNLMRKAFSPKDGPLTDESVEDGEKESMMHLFAGAIGAYKNPNSHRNVNIDSPYAASEAIILANLLLRIIRGNEPLETAS